jgi:chromosome segregation ATPase
MIPLVAKCGLVQAKPELLGKPYKVESSVSMDSLRGFAGAISDANVRDLSQFCDEFKFVELAKTVRDWQAEHPQIDSVIRRELDLVRAALEERLESQDRTIVMLDHALRRLREDGVRDEEKLPVMEAEVSGLRSLLGETSASIRRAAQDTDRVRAAVIDQRMAHGRDICALEEEMRRMGKATEATRRWLRQQESEWKAAIGGLN